jgi:hypothetical protein
VALQGTLDTFALADVLRLLAATKKTGRLRVSGDRGSGSVWVADGDVVATELSISGQHADGPAITLYQLLRFSHGSFTFETGANPVNASSPLAVEPLLAEAELLLAEWRAIEAVVPSLEAWITLRPQLGGRDVVIDQVRWRVVAAVAGGTTAGAVGESLGLDELPVLRALKELVELGLLEVGLAPAGFSTKDPNPFPAEMPQRLRPPAREDAATTPPSLTEVRSGLATVALSEDEHDEPTEPIAPITHLPLPAEPVVSADEAPERPAEPAPAAPVAASPFAAAPVAPEPPSAEDAAEIARQLANLSPRAAKAVAAAAKAATDEEREAALAAIEAEDETVNRGLLLRFLGSVDS